MIKLSLPDGSVREVEATSTSLDVAEAIGPRLAKAALAGELNGQLLDIRAPILESGAFRIITSKDPEGLTVIRHSAEHVLADAVKRLWPDVQIDVGRSDHSDKYQYDFKLDHAFTPEDLTLIQAKMVEIISEKADFERDEMTRADAQKLFEGMGEALKVLRLADIPEGETITVFRHGSFVDLCRGPHVQNASQIGVVHLLESSASYFKGDESSDKLQRIYGTAFLDKKGLKAYLSRIEEAKKRDHRRIGREMDLFSFSDQVGPGLVLWHPKGARVRHLMEDFWRKQHLDGGYELVYSPHIARLDLWDTSGHSGFYRENMYAPMEIDEQPFQLKPMNCPFHIQIFKSKLRSYRDLPIRMAELGTVYRYERSGVLHGLLRVRGFTQDDAHIFVRPQDLASEIESVLHFIRDMFSAFGFSEYQVYLSTRPEKSVGSDEEWDSATQALREALDKAKWQYETDPGEGVFYGPKIDIKIKDSLDRFWQCSTIQLDFNLPERFDISYVDQDGERRRPLMVHRALLGSLERFFGVLIEHHSGHFPLWLAPVQMVVLPLTEAEIPVAEAAVKRFKASGLRVELDARNEKLGYRIREARLGGVPYMAILGPKEAQTEEISLRNRTGSENMNITWEAAIEKLQAEEKDRR